MSQPTCLIQQAHCGRVEGDPVCPKCGIDERSRYYTSEEAAQLDRYHDSYRGAPTDGSAWESGTVERVRRGGSWLNFVAGSSRATDRSNNPPDYSDVNIGFRLAKTAP